MKFDGSSMANSGDAGVVLYHNGEETVVLSFKLEFPCSNNTKEYEAYLIGLAIAFKMGRLVVCQAKGDRRLQFGSLPC